MCDPTRIAQREKNPSSILEREESRERQECGGRGTLSRLVFNALRYYWITTKGYRLRPWASPYIQWRLETFFGKEAAELDARKFSSLMWRERARTKRFLAWVAERRKAQARTWR